ncbi:Nop6p [Saccharomyces cerevisiae Vin13]|nr:Nop6p [Saccharomyces cerevisiae Vin13]
MVKKGNRFIVFVGSLPRDITAVELQNHFKNSSPDQIRLRADKGIAFLEFDADKDRTGIQRRMDIALLQHGTLLKEKKINVELTVGGGGNSQERLEKLKNKNIKLDEERKERLTKMINDGNQKKIAKTTATAAQTSGTDNKPVPAGIHPDRAKLLK